MRKRGKGINGYERFGAVVNEVDLCVIWVSGVTEGQE